MEIPFFRSQIDETEEKLIKEALYNNGANMVGKFEKGICEFFGTQFGVSTTNGTSAMHLALCAMDIKRADKIICSVNSYPNVPEVIRHFDAEPVLVDIDENSFNMSIKGLERALKIHKNKKLKAAFISHTAGICPQMDEIYALAKEYEIKIIDDASRAMGAKYNGKKIGSIKDSLISCFQINPQAQDAVATAGFFVTNDERINERARLVRNNALTLSSIDKFGSLTYIYDITEVGQKYDLNSIAAAYALAQLKKTPNFIARRKQIAKMYHEALSDCPHISLPEYSDDYIYTQFIIKIDKNRDDFAKKLKECGIATALHYIPIYLLSYYKKKYNYKVNDFPNALKNYQQVLSLPIYADLSDDEVNYICEKIIKIARNRV